jgi:hypothetical protein
LFFWEDPMPNGGVPMHMVLIPIQESGVVLYCQGAELRIISKADWDAQKANAPPLATLTPKEGLVLERFLRYWLQDTGNGPLYHEFGVGAEFDY